jgi:hypothetical protein
MGIPQMPDQVKKAPTLALRAVFSGIGKILLAADRPQANGSTGPKHAASKRQPRPGSAGPRPVQRWRSLDETGNVRLLSAEERADGGGALAPEPAAAESDGRASAGQQTMPPTPSQPLAGNVPVGASLVVHELPLPGYDTMSIASIRARLRSLDVDQLQALLVHERKNAERPDVLAMVERRIERLEQGG